MDENLKNKVLGKIKEIYPEISTKDIIVLYGSRAKGFFVKDSDIDTMIFTQNYDYFKRTSIQKGLRKKGEDAGFEITLDNGLLLETKIHHFKIPEFDVVFYHDLLCAQPLTSVKGFRNFQNKVKKEFMNNYESLLFNSYVAFFNEFKNLEGIAKRKDDLSKINLAMKKGIVIQALLRLALVMDKKPFTSDKYLAHEASEIKSWNKISTFVKEINDISSFEEYMNLKILIRDYINSKMPKKPYVGNWWKFLKQFKET
jgi:predicted nucleotidyltransferase